MQYFKAKPKCSLLFTQLNMGFICGAYHLVHCFAFLFALKLFSVMLDKALKESTQSWAVWLGKGAAWLLMAKCSQSVFVFYKYHRQCGLTIPAT